MFHLVLCAPFSLGLFLPFQPLIFVLLAIHSVYDPCRWISRAP